MIEVKNKTDCCGCTACAEVCPVGCITMTSDSDGFLYPTADSEKCIGCGRCDTACPMNSKIGFGTDKAYAAYIKDEEIRRSSSSGGLFSCIADEIFRRGGTVFGAAMDENMRVFHTAVQSTDGMSALRGSKYVQSDMGDCYESAKKLLDAGEPVLFSGTPCQIAGLRSYLGHGYENLYCVDIICHGVPSPKVWKAYCEKRGAASGAEIKKASFRSKSRGWKRFSMSLEFANGEKYSKPLDRDPMLVAFQRNVCLRPSCHSCAFRGRSNRQGDITLGDFWGVGDSIPKMYDDKGTSAVLVNTKKGVGLIENIRSRLVLQEAELSDIEKYNSSLLVSVKQNPNRELFMSEYESDFDLAVKHCCDGTLKERLIRRAVLSASYAKSKLQKHKTQY